MYKGNLWEKDHALATFRQEPDTMSLNLTPTTPIGVRSVISPPRITVIGVGGGGGNAVDNMITTDLSAVDFIVANTDAQQLNHSKADIRLQLGPQLTRGLGAGAKPEIGRQSAEEIAEEISKHLEGSDLVFITAGMGGGTGTGAAPVIARIAKEKGALTIGVVSKPFQFEGKRRERAAESGIAELQKHVDTLIVIPNQNLFNCATQTTSLIEAFRMADDVLHRGVRSITDLMVIPGRINLDFADVKTVMSGMGKAMIGTGFANTEEDGPDWAIMAAERAIQNPLLEETSIKGASGLLVNITGGADLPLHDYTQIMERIGEEADPDAEIISGLLTRDDMEGRVEISVVATGLKPLHNNAYAEEGFHTAQNGYEQSLQPAQNAAANTAPQNIEPSVGQSASQPSGHYSNDASRDVASVNTPRATTIPNYHLDTAPHLHTQQSAQAPFSASQSHTSAQRHSDMSQSDNRRMPSPEQNIYNPNMPHQGQNDANERSGLFSRFFRSRPASSEPQQPHTLNPNPYMRTQQQTQHYNAQGHSMQQHSAQSAPTRHQEQDGQAQNDQQRHQPQRHEQMQPVYSDGSSHAPDPQLEIPAYLRRP